MTKAQRSKRLKVFLAIISVTMVVFGLRLVQIQGIDANAWAGMAREAAAHEVEIPAPRGDIVDREGNVLAGTVDAVAITADPSMTAENAPAIADVIVDVLGDEVDYFTLIEELRKPDSRFTYIARQVPRFESTRIERELRERRLPGVFVEAETLRTYPGEELGANILGYLDGSGAGVAGLESTFDEQLTGEPGVRSFAMSPQGERLPLAETQTTDAVPGHDVVSTIDRDLQWFADRRLAEAVRDSGSGWGLAVTIDVQTGEVLQQSQYPSFNPDTREGIDGPHTAARGVQHIYEPGSVQKVLTFAAAADQGKVDANTRFQVPGSLDVGGFTISDYWDHGTINMTAAGIVARSSNLGTIIAAKQLEDEVLHDYLTGFGLGQRTGVGLPGESPGILADPDTWRSSHRATISFGQGVSVTGIQMAGALAAIGNDGTYIEPRLVQGVRTEDGVEPIAEPETREVISPRAAREVLTMMEATVADGGTAPAAQIDGYRVAGKTGTAWRVDPDTGSYARGQYTVSFAGIAPADDPRFVTYVVLDNPSGDASGGGTAAPVFADVMQAALEQYGVPPSGKPYPDTSLEW